LQVDLVRLHRTVPAAGCVGSLGIAVVIATLTGPVLAVLITRFIDARRDRKTRQTDLFRILMRSRRSNLSPEYVAALNTVEVEFAGVKAVENAQRELLSHLNSNAQAQPMEWMDRVRRLQTRSLYAIATYLGYEMEQLDVLEGGYVPTLWGTNEVHQQEITQALRELLAGTRTLKVEVAQNAAPTNVRPIAGGIPVAPTSSDAARTG
jgi:hypothetical protein